MGILQSIAVIGLFIITTPLISFISPALAADGEARFLQFPFANPCVLERLAAFGIPNWSGDQPHNGIDLVIPPGLASARIIAPAAGTVTNVETTENPFSNPPGAIMVSIFLEIDERNSIKLVIEPGTVDPALKAAQEAALAVVAGQKVSTGAHLADLLNGQMGYAHLHLMLTRDNDEVCPYSFSTAHARYAYDNLAAAPNSNVPDGLVCYGQP